MHREIYYSIKNDRKKMIGHRIRFRENDDLPLRRGPVVKKKPPFSNAHVLITRKIMDWGMTLRWLVTVSSTFQDLEFDGSL